MEETGVTIPPECLAIHAELILAQVLAGGEAALDRRCSLEQNAQELTLFLAAAAHAVVESCRA